jgi:hypothetical protein
MLILPGASPSGAAFIAFCSGRAVHIPATRANVPLVHPITAAHLDAGSLPNADAASNPPASNSFAKTLGEYHDDRASV